MTSLPAQPLDDDLTIEVSSRAPSPHAAPVRVSPQSVAANTAIWSPEFFMLDGGGNARQEDMIQSRTESPHIVGSPSAPITSTEQMMNEPPMGAQETTSREGSRQPSQSMACSPGPSTRPATSRYTPPTVSPHTRSSDASVAQPNQTLGTVDLDGFSVASVPPVPMDIRESSTRPLTKEPQVDSIHITTTPTSADANPSTDAEDLLFAEILALAGDDTEHITVSPSPQGRPPAAVPPIVIDLLPTQADARAPQNAPWRNSVIPKMGPIQQQLSSEIATPLAGAGNYNNSRKRAADGSVLDERRNRARRSPDILDGTILDKRRILARRSPDVFAGTILDTRRILAGRGADVFDGTVLDQRRFRARRSADETDLPMQLPIPQDSPITTNTGTLTKLLDSAIAALQTRTVDLLPVNDDQRIDMLRDACCQNDRFYLLTHVVYCLWSANEWGILSQLNFAAHLTGVSALTTILESNRNLTKEVFNLFMNFPRPPERLLLDHSPDFKSLLEEVRCFLFHLASKFATLREAVLRRRCPPCPAEFKFSLKLSSPVLQKALFRSILRQTGEDPGWQRKALLLFEEEMINAAGSAISIAELNAYHGAQLPQIVKRWALMYGQQLKDYQEVKIAAHRQQLNRHILDTTTGSLSFHGVPHQTHAVAPAQRPNVSRPHQTLNSPGRQRQLHLTSPAPFQEALQYPQRLNQPLLQQQSYSPTAHSYAQPPTRTPSTTYPDPQTHHSNLHYPQPQSSHHDPQRPSQPAQPGPLSSGATSTMPAGAHTAASQQVQSLNWVRPRGTYREWAVKAVVGERQRNGTTEFRVIWEGRESDSDSWELESHLRHAQQAITKFRMMSTVNPGNPAPVQDYGTPRGRPPSSSGDQHQPSVVSPNSMPSALIQQQRNTQPTPIELTVQQREAAQRARYLQHPNTTQTSQTPGLQQPSTPAVPSTTTWSPSMHVPPHTQQRPNSNTPANTNEGVVVPGREYPLQGQPFFPSDPNHVLAQIAIPDPEILALHQIELRSPKYHKMVDFNQSDSDARYYQYVEEVIYLPELLTKDSNLIRWKVPIPAMALSRKTIALPPIGEFSIRQRNISNGDAQFRLKSIIFTDKWRIMPKLSDFCTQPAKWPQCLSVSVNEKHGVDFRRKAHYGVDLATDITEMLREDDNEIVIGAIFAPAEAELKFLMALEIICVADHNTLLNMPARIPAASALSAVTNTLQNQSSDDDDLIIQPSISIDLVDPFMSVIWVTPVRGRNCTHRECFDLEAFFLSRTSRAKESGVSSPDKWYCPICRSDCRPPMLVLDEFLLDVRKTLEGKGQSHAKAILVKEDGSWEPRLEQPRKDERADTPDSDTFMTGAPNAAAGAVTRPAAISTSAPASARNTPRPQFDSNPIIILDDDE